MSGYFVKLLGDGGITRGLRAAADSPRTRLRVGEKLYDRCIRIMEVSKEQYCPVSEKGSHGNPRGFLRDSGQVLDPKYRSNGVQVDMVYTAPYAVYVHEDLHAQHKVGQAKYLERPVLLEKKGLLEDMEQAVVEVLRDAVAAAMLGKVISNR